MKESERIRQLKNRAILLEGQLDDLVELARYRPTERLAATEAQVRSEISFVNFLLRDCRVTDSKILYKPDFLGAEEKMVAEIKVDEKTFVVRDWGNDLTPYVVHQRLQDGSFHSGNYCITLQDALQTMVKRSEKNWQYLEKKGGEHE